MKKKWIIAIAALTFYTGITNVSNAQDDAGASASAGGASVKSLFNYFVDSPWLMTAGFTFMDNDGTISPFSDFSESRHLYPMHMGFEKSLEGYSPWPWASNLRVSFNYYRESSFPNRLAQGEANLIYSLKDISDNILGWDWFSPAVSIGGSSVQVRIPERRYKNKFINFNVTAIGDFWAFDNVGIRASGGAHVGLLFKGDGWYQYNIGLVYRVGAGTGKSAEVEEEQTTSTYKRTQEEEDALIHLRGHLNQ